jgi:hypothetical protein
VDIIHHFVEKAKKRGVIGGGDVLKIIFYLFRQILALKLKCYEWIPSLEESEAKIVRSVVFDYAKPPIHQSIINVQPQNGNRLLHCAFQ